jgi:hypothetical protein
MDSLLENEKLQGTIKKGVQSVTKMLYSEMYVYVWFVCIYHVILVVLVLTNLVLLVKMSFHHIPNSGMLGGFPLPFTGGFRRLSDEDAGPDMFSL